MVHSPNPQTLSINNLPDYACARVVQRSTELCDRNNNGNINPTASQAVLSESMKKAGETPKSAGKEFPLFGRFRSNSGSSTSKMNEPAQESTIDTLRSRRHSFEAAIADQSRQLETDSKVMEGSAIERGAWTGQSIGVFTSGGDSQGMNASLRSIVRMGQYLGCRVYYIKEGYQGMVDGGENIVEATWSSTSNMIHVGGTIIGSARCMDFKERWGRLKAAQNLIQHHITNLIAIGGDGSLTGANCFRQEWPSLLKELVDKNLVGKEKLVSCAHLNIVGLVGSIDNDFCGTDLTIGVDSALHRIVDAIDDIMTTAVSHKRAFVLEIMGRMCGFLPLVAGIATEASAIFIPEDPPWGDWKQYICDLLTERLESGEKRRTHIVLVAEGAADRKGNPIKCTDVQKVLSERLKMDTRVTVLGHVQRGGNTSAMDRMLGSRQGAEAVLALMDAKPDTPACVIGVDGNNLVRVPLIKAVERTKMVGGKMSEGSIDDVIKLRGMPIFTNLYVYLLQQKVVPHPNLVHPGRKKVFRIGMVMVGQPACGMNACARGFVSVCVTNGYEPVFIHDGWEGLCQNKIRVTNWNEVQFWAQAGGSNIGIRPSTANEADVRIIASKLAEHKIEGLIIVGGFEAFQSACELLEGRATYSELCIPMCVVPATIANNVPGCDLSLGADTALNQICEACDDLKHSAFSVQNCVYVVEVGGEKCGYLATLAGITSGADAAYIKEEKFTVRDIQSMCNAIKGKLLGTNIQQGLILRNEEANANITTDFIYRVLSEEGKDAFITRKAVLGYTQEGNVASPHDRFHGVAAGCMTTCWMVQAMEESGVKDGKVYTNSPDSITVGSTMGSVELGFVPVKDLIPRTDFRNRVPKHQWWRKLRPLLKILASSTAVVEFDDGHHLMYDESDLSLLEQKLKFE